MATEGMINCTLCGYLTWHPCSSVEGMSKNDIEACKGSGCYIDGEKVSAEEYDEWKAKEAPKSDNVYKPSHYTKYKIEPITFIMQNELPFAMGNVIKYVMRYKDKNGLEDLRKARRYIDMIIEQEYPGKDT
jgi:hypothetical protein